MSSRGLDALYKEEQLSIYPEHIEIVKARLSPNAFEVIEDTRGFGPYGGT